MDKIKGKDRMVGVRRDSRLEFCGNKNRITILKY